MLHIVKMCNINLCLAFIYININASTLIVVILCTEGSAAARYFPASVVGWRSRETWRPTREEKSKEGKIYKKRVFDIIKLGGETTWHFWQLETKGKGCNFIMIDGLFVVTVVLLDHVRFCCWCWPHRVHSSVEGRFQSLGQQNSEYEKGTADVYYWNIPAT